MPIIPLITCARCSRRCDDKSINEYNFENDVERSEAVESHILKHINLHGMGRIICQKSQEHIYPDLEISLASSPSKVKARLEVKLQSRTFMKITSFLPNADLLAWETVALNLSDLQRYIKIQDEEKIPLHLVWKLSRYCLGDVYLYQELSVLKSILAKYGEKRTFKRREGRGDIDASGRHRGVIVNYHFSVNELLPFKGYLDFLSQIKDE